MQLKTFFLGAVSGLALTSSAFGQVPTEPTAVDEVIVTGYPLGLTPSDVVSNVAVMAGDDLVHRHEATLGDTLNSIPGINSDTFGGGSSRPVIRGQTAPRVRILSNGAALQDASEVSPDHAVTIEPLLIERIEVLRGPSTLLYGGGAIGGAVNVVDHRVPRALPAEGGEGAFEVRKGTGDDETAAAASYTAAIGGFALHLEGASRRSDDYDVPDWSEDVLHGSFNKSQSGSLGVSWIGQQAYLGVAYAAQDSDYGLPGHNHEYESCHPHGASLHCGSHDEEEEEDHDHEHEGEEHDVPVVDLKSRRVDVRGEFGQLGLIERLRFQVGFTDYAHDEIDEEVVATTFTNKGYDGRVELEHATIGGLRGVIGVQASQSDFAALGTESFIPPSDTNTKAIFALEEYEVGAARLELAARQEWQETSAVGRPDTDHEPLSLSAGAVWDVAPGWSAAVSLSRSQRAPSAQELYARGVHLATNTYEIGAPTLSTETVKSAEVTLRKTLGATRMTGSVYRYSYDGYIYAETLDQFEDFRLIQYGQTDATFSGFEGEIEHDFTPDFSATLFGDVVRGKLEGGDGNVPRIPAARLGARANYQTGAWATELEYYKVFDQDDVAAFETATPGYDMVNFTLSYDLPKSGRAATEIFLRGTNLLDELALNHASFLTKVAPLRGRKFAVGLRTTF